MLVINYNFTIILELIINLTCGMYPRSFMWLCMVAGRIIHIGGKIYVPA